MTAVTEKLGSFSADSDVKPEEEVLGSVTHETQSTERPIQLRTSARVSKKLRLDLQTNAAPAPVVEKKETKPEEKVPEQKSNTVRRVHELWSTEDKNAFFEALNEYGKDFDAIQTHMNNKRKKRGINHSISKNRDQARHFYYRTWHKISKYLEFPQEVKKAVREQYGLINFGEFRKKVGFVSEKNSVKLNELIYSGSTQVRIKGKTLRIKTPVCRALRKLNQLQETTADVKLPTRITIELRPRNKESWCRVQSLAMNPRARTTLPLPQQLISLINYLQKKWQSPEAKLKEKSTPHNADNKPESVDSDAPLLRLAPKQGINIVAPSVRSGEFITSSRISLLAYEEKFGIEGQAISESLKQLQTANKSGKSSRNVKKQHVEDEKSKAKEEPDTHTQTLAQTDKVLSDKDFVSSTVNQLLLLNSEHDQSAKDGVDENEWNSPVKDDFELDTEISASENKEEIIERAKAGWNAKNAEAIRIGDLYLMFGVDSKLQLDYWWEDPIVDKEQKATESVGESSHNEEKNKLSESLRKLVSIAKLYLTKDKNQCTCGHICKSNNKIVNGRSRVINKPKVTINNNVSENDRLLNVTTDTTPKNHITNVTVNRIHSNYVPSRGVSSFKEQLDLQYYNRRRSGDKQRSLPSVPKVTIQVIKPPKEGDRVEVREEKNDTAEKDHSADITSRINVNNTINNNSVFSQLPLFPDNISDKDLLLQDEDTKSSCSTITRFLNQALPKVIPQPIDPNPDGFAIPLISQRIVDDVDLNQNTNDRASPTLSMASNFSIGSLLAQLDNPKPSSAPVTLDEDTRFSTDVETQFQRLINESSVDYTEKFASIAAQMASENNNKI
ncbi:protein cramped isoform X2 [Planococcus citri]|uniref:protein cramped isoform X2 n=1 Tax=Planococcus citri TaxID=170843 RepID=UPI0031F7BC22